MVEETRSSPGGSPADSNRLSIADENRLRELTDALLDDEITPTQLQELQAIVVRERAAAVLYYKLVHLWTVLPLHLGRPEIDLRALDRGEPHVQRTMDEAMILPAIADLEDQGELATTPQRVEFTHSTPRRRRTMPRAGWLGSAAALLLIALYAAWRPFRVASPVAVKPPDPQPVASATRWPAVITATAGAVFSGSADKAGSGLATADILELQQGAVQLTFADGAVAVVHAPARIHVAGRNAVTLDCGTLTAHVPVSAHGFCVTAPGVSAVDLGTDFGVRSAPGSDASELQVFAGRVSATWLNSGGQPVDAPQILTGGQAFSHSAQSLLPVATAFSETGFDRSIDRVRLTVPAASTGVNAIPDGPDPDWLICAVPFDPKWTPKPAIAPARPQGAYPGNTPEGKWITLENGQSVAAGDYVFRTCINLKGFDPTTVVVSAQVAADNCIKDIRVNGSSTGVSTKGSLNSKFALEPIKLPAAAWIEGTNQVDIVVFNTNFATPEGASPMALRVIWSITAQARVIR